MKIRWLKVELLYAACTKTGAALVAEINQILKDFERGNYAPQKQESTHEEVKKPTVS